MAHISQVQHYNEPVVKQIGFAAIVQTGKTLHLSCIVSIDEEVNGVGSGDMVVLDGRVFDILE